MTTTSQPQQKSSPAGNPSTEAADSGISSASRYFRVPARYSAEWWSWIAGTTLAFSIISFAGLYSLGIFENVQTLLICALLISILGDIVVAVAFEAIAPSVIAISPGERSRNDQEISATGVVDSGFEASSVGRIVIRGELWSARHIQGSDLRLARGDEVRVVGRDGLTLLIGD